MKTWQKGFSSSKGHNLRSAPLVSPRTVKASVEPSIPWCCPLFTQIRSFLPCLYISLKTFFCQKNLCRKKYFLAQTSVLQTEEALWQEQSALRRLCSFEEGAPKVVFLRRRSSLLRCASKSFFGVETGTSHRRPLRFEVQKRHKIEDTKKNLVTYLISKPTFADAAYEYFSDITFL